MGLSYWGSWDHSPRWAGFVTVPPGGGVESPGGPNNALRTICCRKAPSLPSHHFPVWTGGDALSHDAERAARWWEAASRVSGCQCHETAGRLGLAVGKPPQGRCSDGPAEQVPVPAPAEPLLDTGPDVCLPRRVRLRCPPRVMTKHAPQLVCSLILFPTDGSVSVQVAVGWPDKLRPCPAPQESWSRLKSTGRLTTEASAYPSPGAAAGLGRLVQAGSLCVT